MQVDNAITKSPFVPRYVYDAVAAASSSLNVLVYVTSLSIPKWDFGSEWAKPLGSEAAITPIYLSQDDMRFGPRYYGRSETALIAQAIAERQPLPEPPLPLD